MREQSPPSPSRPYTIRIATTDEDLKGVLTLQQENLKKTISQEQQAKDGFVTLQHDLELLQYMKTHIPQIIAVAGNNKHNETTHQGRVVGYAMSKTVGMRNRIPLLDGLVKKLDNANQDVMVPSKDSYYVMGQVCVASEYRGSGVFRDLYLHHKLLLSKLYPGGIVTAISASNPRSMRAHEKVGFRILATFEGEEDTWHAVIWDWK